MAGAHSQMVIAHARVHPRYNPWALLRQPHSHQLPIGCATAPATDSGTKSAAPPTVARRRSGTGRRATRLARNTAMAMALRVTAVKNFAAAAAQRTTASR